MRKQSGLRNKVYRIELLKALLKGEIEFPSSIRNSGRLKRLLTKGVSFQSVQAFRRKKLECSHVVFFQKTRNIKKTKDKRQKIDYIRVCLVRVAQLDRVSVSETEGHEFDSRRGH